MPYARIPPLDDQNRSITVVRRAREMMYRRAYDDFMTAEPTSIPGRPSPDLLIVSPPFLAATDGEEPTTTQLATARAARLGTYGHLVAWHQGAYSSCPAAIRARYYQPTPLRWPSVEVPHGCMAELPWVHTYALDDLREGRSSTWAIFRTEWALHAATQLYETFRDRRVMWRYPPRLLDWIRALGPDEVCKVVDGHNEEAARTLEALLILGDQLPSGAAFTKRLHERAVDRRDRDGWVAVEIEVTDGVKQAKVAEDLSPFDMPYSTHVLTASTFGGTPGGWAGAVAASRAPRYPGGGSVPPPAAAAAPVVAPVAAAASAPVAAAAAAPVGPPPTPAGTHPPPGDMNRIVAFDPVDH